MASEPSACPTSRRATYLAIIMSIKRFAQNLRGRSDGPRPGTQRQVRFCIMFWKYSLLSTYTSSHRGRSVHFQEPPGLPGPTSAGLNVIQLLDYNKLG